MNGRRPAKVGETENVTRRTAPARGAGVAATSVLATAAFHCPRRRPGADTA
ncbi:hypothetical protein GCM10009654_48660 [Streptomyces hebeiensis]|uniref:Uncharacterized protein n=1 Tax=Streptomyces hebeiensis TaxID=229486 RepID=A0ABP4FMK5_9ACTN